MNKLFLQQNHMQKKPFQISFISIFQKIIQFQEQLDTLRQLLNQEISFNLKDLYVIVAGTSTGINYKHIDNFVRNQNYKQKQKQKQKQKEKQKEKQNHKQKENNNYNNNNAIQSMIRYYNGNSSLNLSFSEFSSIFLNRQNRLLTKMTLQRDSIGTLPNYILSYSKKILQKQIQLHKELIQYRIAYTKQTQLLIDELMTTDNYLDEDKFFNFLLQITNRIPEQFKIQFGFFLRYLKPFSKGKIQRELLQSLLKVSNVLAVTQYLKQKQKKKSNKHGILSPSSSKTFNDPFIRAQFHDCLTRPKLLQMFSYREIKSIQKHFDRITIPNQKISTKLQKFQQSIQKTSKLVLQAIKDILWLEKQIEYARIQLGLCVDFYPVLFWECFHKDKQGNVIPSAMEIYFQQFAIHIPINQIYLLFKRYAWHLQGKMDFNSFCRMFDVCQAVYSTIQKNRQIKSLVDVSVETKKNFLLLLATIIKNQKKIQIIKNKLQNVKNMNLRDIFACFDTDQDGYLSITDFRVLWKKYFNIQVAKQIIQLLWFRMGYLNQTQIIKYQQFIKQMSPKSMFNTKQKKLRKVKSQNTAFKFLNK